MANHSYLRIWTRDFSEETMLAQFARFLTSAPLSASMNTFSELTVQPIDATETPVASWDLRPLKHGAAEVAALALQHLNTDSSYIATAQWDLWELNLESLKWIHGPQPPKATSSPISASNISSPATPDSLHPEKPPILSTLPITHSNTPSAAGWPPHKT
jgi:hypothetical protein